MKYVVFIKIKGFSVSPSIDFLRKVASPTAAPQAPVQERSVRGEETAWDPRVNNKPPKKSTTRNT